MATNNSINTPLIIPVSRGGTGAATLTGVLTGNSTGAVTANAITQYYTLVAAASNAVSSIAPSATSGIPYISQGSSSNPAFGTAVVAGGGTGNITFTAYSLITGGTTATGAFQNVSGIGSAGQVLTSSGSGLPTWAAPSAGGLVWSVITISQSAVAAHAYICNGSGTVVLTLPSTASVGDTFLVTGMNNATGWSIAQNMSQVINFGTAFTMTGTGGSLSSTNIYDMITVTCIVANTGWIAYGAQGNITVV